MFEEFKSRHNKQYGSAEEEAMRFMIFVENMKKAKSLAKLNPQAMFGASRFADLSEAEFKSYHNGDAFYSKRTGELSDAPFAPMYTPAQLKGIPSDLDWRAKGAVTQVKDQGQCGSCWSFSTTGGIEGQWFLAGHPLTSLSEQFFVSCDTVDQACNGGLMNTAYEWVLSSHGGSIPTEKSYPYVSGGGSVPACSTKGTFGAKITGHTNIYHSEEQMRATVAERGPLSIAVDASAWQFYLGGLMSSCGGSSLDHGVLIVGYSMTGGSYNSPYWIIKNSWAASWGEQGYIYVSYGSNQCLLTNYPVTAIVNGSAPPAPPRPSGSYFSHTIFDDEKCTAGAQTYTWAVSKCVSWDGVSFTAECQSSGIAITAYPYSLNCTGSSTQLTEPLNTCTAAQEDFCYYTNECHSSSTARTARVGHSPKAGSHFSKMVGRTLNRK